MLPLYQTPIDSLSDTPRETREGWPLLIVEAEANGVLWSTNERALPWLVRQARRAGTKDFYTVLAALVSPVQTIFSSRYTISIYMSPSPCNLGRQSCKVACL